jgi:hypothetical protein
MLSVSEGLHSHAQDAAWLDARNLHWWQDLRTRLPKRNVEQYLYTDVGASCAVFLTVAHHLHLQPALMLTRLFVKHGGAIRPDYLPSAPNFCSVAAVLQQPDQLAANPVKMTAFFLSTVAPVMAGGNATLSTFAGLVRTHLGDTARGSVPMTTWFSLVHAFRTGAPHVTDAQLLTSVVGHRDSPDGKFDFEAAVAVVGTTSNWQPLQKVCQEAGVDLIALLRASAGVIHSLDT